MKNQSQFFGWRMVSLAVVSQAFQAGLLIYSFGLFALAFEEKFGVSRQQVMWCATLLSISTNLISPFMGDQVDKRSIRSLMIFAAICMSASMLVIAFANSIYIVWAVFALLLPFANLLLGQLPTSALISRWFRIHRGKALGISALGTSIGGLIFPKLFTYVLDANGMTQAFVMLSMLALLLLLPVIWKVVIDSPQNAGQFPDGLETDSETEASKVEASKEDVKWAVADILKSASFWAITVTIGLSVGVYIALLNNLAPYAVSLGFTRSEGATLISIMTLAAMPSKLIFGFLIDRMDLRLAYWIALSLVGAGIATLLAANNYLMLIAAVLLLGLSAGSKLIVWAALVGKVFGLASYGRVFGIMNLAMTPLTAFTSPFAGWVYDSTGNYNYALTVFLVLTGVSAVALMFCSTTKAKKPEQIEVKN